MFGELAHRLTPLLRMGNSLLVPTSQQPESIYSMTAIGTVATSQTGATTLVGTGVGSLTLPPNFFQVGTTILIDAQGYYTSTTNTTASLVVSLTLGGVEIATLNGSTGIKTTASLTDAPMRMQCKITCRAIGLLTTVMACGTWDFGIVTAVPTNLDATISMASVPFKSGNAGAVPAAVATVPSVNRELALALAVTTGSTLTLSFVSFNVYQIY